MLRLKIITICCIFCLLCSCEKLFYFGSEYKDIYVYKFKDGKDYSNNANLRLSDDKSEIRTVSYNLPCHWPVKLAEGYYLNGTSGVNAGYLSLTCEEYNSLETLPSRDSLYNLLIDKDPYIEFYHRFDYNDTFFDGYCEDAAYGIDTTYLNKLIRTGRLEEYFERQK